MRILLLTLSLLFTQELEVQGDLKVSGSIDAQNNPVKNVGVPQSLTDAINGNVLQDALRENHQYEYEFYMAKVGYNPGADDFSYWQMGNSSSGSWSSNFILNVLSVKLPEGWEIHRTIKIADTSCNGSSCGDVILYILRIPIEE